MDTTKSVVTNEERELMKQAVHYDNPVKFLRALVAILMEGANAIRVGIVIQEDDDDLAALWFKCDTGNIIIAGRREAVDELQADVVGIIERVFSESCTWDKCSAQPPSNNTVH